jgi:hypothetical protein
MLKSGFTQTMNAMLLLMWQTRIRKYALVTLLTKQTFVKVTVVAAYLLKKQ